MEKLSFKQQKFFDFIKKFKLTYGQAPSYEEIMSSLGFQSLGTVDWYVKTLEKEGYLSRIKGSNGKRAISVTDENVPSAPSELPLMGLIAAGLPIEALENPENINVPAPLVDPNNFVLQVKGNSMIEESIQDGDYIIVKKTSIARSGQIIVAIINGEATLKCYVPKKNHIELHPRNPKFPIIFIQPTDNFFINGVLLYSFREYLN
tara:strand:+ start:1040 stop:1654 length:615 start_codon:yes stop_codon:yes gene_type:complete